MFENDEIVAGVVAPCLVGDGDVVKRRSGFGVKVSDFLVRERPCGGEYDPDLSWQLIIEFMLHGQLCLVYCCWLNSAV